MKSKAWEKSTWVRVAVVVAIAALAFFAAVGIGWLGLEKGGATGGGRADDFFYDAFYRLRPQQDMSHAEVVLVAVDQASLTAEKRGWPWPRKNWGEISTYLEQAGAKVITFDILFPEPGIYGDDEAFAAAMNKLKTPVVYASAVKDADWEPFAPPIKEAVHGAINIGNDKIFRRYVPEVEGLPSLAEQTAMSSGMAGPALQTFLPESGEAFLLHYYGPHVRSDGKQTFRYVPAYGVLSATRGVPGAEERYQIGPDTFRDKIVIVCAIAAGTFDLKVSPLSDEYPGPEVNATAIENMLHGQKVHLMPGSVGYLAAGFGALLVSAGVVFPRRATVKVLVPIVAAVGLLAMGIALFRGDAIWWMSPVTGLLSMLIATPLAFGYTYFSEDRQRRFMLKALSKVVSPAVAEQLSRDPERLALGTVRTEITVLFTDLANFTDLAEGMDVQDLGKMVNRYLGEMSTQVFQQDGTLDKYIGDAVMCFWNAPLPQSDHAVRACRAALAMASRDAILNAEYAGKVKRPLFTRIGINTTSAAVGFVGSEHLFNFTAMGDGVNLASRLEGANKLYDTRILLSETTVEQLRGAAPGFYLRKIDVLRVKGKQQPMAVYELLGERTAADSLLETRIRGYEIAFAAYEAQHWDESERLLLELCQAFGEDGAAAALLARVRDYRQNPPPQPWDGVYVSTTK